MIPKILLQTSREPYPQYVKDMWNARVDRSWKIEWFDDKSIIQFFKDNPIEGFENIVEVFNNIVGGSHKADLFRYYYLYLNGGFFVDSDMMVHVHMNELNNPSYDHVFVIADLPMLWENDPHPIITPPHAFNALMGCIPKSKIIYDALKDLYKVKPKLLQKHYFYVIYKLYTILQQHKNDYNVKLYNEWAGEDVNEATHTIDDDGLRIASHFYSSKTIPKGLKMNKHNDYIEVTAYFENRAFQLFVHNPADDLVISKVICEQGHWEPDISKRILNGMTKGGIFLDIGANIGWHSKIVQDAGFDVICFEPQPQNFKLLEKNCKKEGSTLHNLGLGSSNTTFMIERDSTNYGNSFISNNGTDEITVVRLDDIIDDDIISKIDVIKMDVQGFETEVLKGAEEFLKKLKPGVKLLLEISPTSPSIDIKYFHEFISGKKYEVLPLGWVPQHHNRSDFTIQQAVRLCHKPQTVGVSLDIFDQCGPAIDAEITL